MPAPVRPLRLAPEWDRRFTRMCGVSAVAHVLVLVAVVMLSARAALRPMPLVAYTVELTDPNALGGRLPPGAPGRDLAGGAAKEPAPEAHGEPAAPKPPEPVAKAEPVPPPPTPSEPAAKVEPPPPPTPPEAKPPEPKVEEPKPPEPKAPEVKLPDVKPQPPKPPEPKPEAKVEPKPSPKPPPKPEPKPEAKPQPNVGAKPVVPQPQATAKATPKPPPPPTPPAGHAGATPAAGSAAPGEPAHDAYAAAAERWRSRATGTGGGLGGTDGGSGPVGAGGEGPGGGGQLVGLEFLAYRQQVITTIKGRWTNVIARPGLVAAVRFEIASDGAVSAIQLSQSSGNAAYDASALRAVQQANPLPAPPGRYAKDFHEFVIEFHSEERGGQEAG